MHWPRLRSGLLGRRLQMGGLLCAAVVVVLLVMVLLVVLRREMLLRRQQRWLLMLLLRLMIGGAMRVVAGGPLHPQSNVLHAAVKLIGEIIDASVVVGVVVGVRVDEWLDLLLGVDVVIRADTPGGVCVRCRSAVGAAVMMLMVIVALVAVVVVVMVVIGVVDFVGVGGGAQIVVDHDDTDCLLDLTGRGSGGQQQKGKRNTR